MAFHFLLNCFTKKGRLSGARWPLVDPLQTWDWISRIKIEVWTLIMEWPCGGVLILLYFICLSLLEYWSKQFIDFLWHHTTPYEGRNNSVLDSSVPNKASCSVSAKIPVSYCTIGCTNHREEKPGQNPERKWRMDEVLLNVPMWRGTASNGSHSITPVFGVSTSSAVASVNIGCIN